MLYDILKYVFIGAAIVMIIIGIIMKSSKSKKDKKWQLNATENNAQSLSTTRAFLFQISAHCLYANADPEMV